MAERILIVDDDPVQRRLIENMVTRLGYEAIVADGGDPAMTILGNPESAIDGVVLDLVMPDLDGLGVLARMRELDVTVPVIVQTAHGGIDNVISAMRAGATDFVVKPAGAERLQVSLRNALTTRALAGELTRIKRSRAGTLTFKDVITRSQRMFAVLRAAEKAAASMIPVLIEGESGVGKELVARAIHGSGARRAKPLVTINCGAIPDNLVESILFGHEKGAFTGATERHTGKFIEADGGTLFLDEIGELPLAAQVKLLRAIQEGEVEPVGGRKPIKVDVRVISATNRDLLADVKSGRFREDLFYRLHVFPITVPPLRDRAEDIPDLVRHFLIRFATEEGKRVRSVAADALRMLIGYRWPGNVRQLENTMFRAVVLTDGEEIGLEDIPQIAIAAASPSDGPLGDQSTLPPTLSPPIDGGPLAIHEPALYAFPEQQASASRQAEPSGVVNMLDETGEVRALEHIEADVLRLAIAHYRGQMSEVARKLQIGRSTLYRKLEGLGLGTMPAGTPSPDDVAAG